MAGGRRDIPGDAGGSQPECLMPRFEDPGLPLKLRKGAGGPAESKVR